jgi:GntR family transcriptional regulator
VVPPARVAEILGVGAGEACVVRAREMYVNDVPTQLADSYDPLDIAAGTILEEVDCGAGGLMSRMADLGQAQARIAERITVRPPNEREAASQVAAASMPTIHHDQVSGMVSGQGDHRYPVNHQGYVPAG